MTEPSAFVDKAHTPTDEEVAKVLGPAVGLWNELKNIIVGQYEPITEEWAFSGKKHGWAFRLKQKKRAIVNMVPLDGRFRAGFALGEKAVAAARQNSLPADVMKIIDEAPKYAEGRGVSMLIYSKEDVQSIVKIAAAKMAN